MNTGIVGKQNGNSYIITLLVLSREQGNMFYKKIEGLYSHTLTPIFLT